MMIQGHFLSNNRRRSAKGPLVIWWENKQKLCPFYLMCILNISYKGIHTLALIMFQLRAGGGGWLGVLFL